MSVALLSEGDAEEGVDLLVSQLTKELVIGSSTNYATFFFFSMEYLFSFYQLLPGIREWLFDTSSKRTAWVCHKNIPCSNAIIT